MKIQECPFCGENPTGKKFCSTERGPILICDHCGCDGPPPLAEGEEYLYNKSNYRRLEKKAIEKWNCRLGKTELVNGIRLAADVAKDYDRLSYHHCLVSDCILGKLNVMKGRPRKNPAAKRIKEALDCLDRKLDSLEGTMRFMARSAGEKR